MNRNLWIRDRPNDGCTVWAAITVMTLCVCTHGAHRQDAVEPPEQIGAIPLPTAAESTHPLYVHVRAPILADELECYARLLQLAAPQAQYMTHLHARYKSRCEELLKAKWPELSDMAEAIGESLFRRQYSPGVTADYGECIAREAELNSALANEELEFFQALERVLSDTQAARFPRLKAMRERACRNVLEIDMPAASVDLASICAMLEISGYPEAPLDPAIAEYELAVTPVMMELDRELAFRRASLFWLDMRLQYVEEDEYAAIRSDPVALRSVWRERRQALLARGARLQSDISRMNEQCVNRIRAALESEPGPTLESMWHTAAYPGVFPDESDPRELAVHLMNSELVSVDRRNDLRNAWSEYRIRYDDICTRMRNRADDWYEQKSRWRLGRGYEEYRNDLRALHTKRLSTNDDLLELFTSLLPPEEVADVANRIHERRELIKQSLARLTDEASR